MTVDITIMQAMTRGILIRSIARHERIQHVGKDDTDQQRHEEGLRPVQCGDHRDYRQDRQGQAARVHRHADDGDDSGQQGRRA